MKERWSGESLLGDVERDFAVLRERFAAAGTRGEDRDLRAFCIGDLVLSADPSLSLSLLLRHSRRV